MSTRKTRPEPGLEERHARSCGSQKSNGGRRCTCTPTWQGSVWDKAAGKPLKKTFPTRSAAKRWRQDAQAALRSGDLSADRGPLLRDAVVAWLDGARAGQVTNRSGDPFKPAAIRAYEQNLRLRVLPVLGDYRIREIEPRDVQRMVDGLVAARLAPATIDSALTPLRAFYRRAVARGDVRHNPTLRIEKPGVRSKLKEIAAPKEAAAMIAALDPADRPLWAVAFYAGLRRGELIGLRWEDVDLASGVLRVQRGWDDMEGEISPKSAQGRRNVPIPAVLRDHLDQHRVAGDGEGRVFGTPRWVQGAGDRARTRWEPAGLPILTLHAARHTFASLMIAAGVNVKAISTYMGHANIAITLNLYGHLLPGNEQQAAGLLDAFLAREVGGVTVAHTVAHPERVQA